MLHQTQKRPRSEDESQEAQAKRARNDSIITSQEQRCNDNKPAIEAWCKAQQTHPKARWYEKLHAWETNGCRDVRRKSTATTSPPTPVTITQTPGMDSPAEILNIRRQWGDAKPDRRIHPLDKVEVPEWPTEDSLAVCTKRPDGLYKCLHPEGSHHKCCREGLTEKNKKGAIAKQIRAWKTRVEEMVLKGELHVAHKMWPDWNKKSRTEYEGEVERWDGVLALLGGLQGKNKGGQGLGTPSPRPVAAPIPRPAASPARRTPIEAARQASPQEYAPQAFVPSASPTQQMSPLQQATHTHTASRQFQHQSPQQRPVQHPANTDSTASSPAHPGSYQQPQAQPTYHNSPTRDFATSATSRSPDLSAKHGYGSPAFAYAGPHSNGSPPQRAAAGTFPQPRSHQAAVIASGAVPGVGQQTPQYAPTPDKTLSPVAAARSDYPSNIQATPQSFSREQEQRSQQQQASKPARNVSQQQAAVQLPSSGAATNHAAKTCPAPTQMTTSPSPSTAAKRTSASINTPKMSSTHTLSPDKSSTLAASSPTRPKHAVNYQPEAIRMLQQQIKDHEPIVLGGLKITRDDVTTSMNGCIRKLTTALQSQAEEVAQKEVQEAARKEAEEVARKEAEETARKEAEDTARANFKDASQDQAETTDEIAALAVSNDNEGHELDYLFSDTPIRASHSHPINFGNVNEYLFDDSADSNEWRPEIMPDLPPDFGKMDLIEMTRRAFEEEPSPSQPEEQPEQEEDTLADLSYPEAWFIEDVEDFVTSGPLPEWMQRPTTDFTLEHMSRWDADMVTPSDPQDWLQATRAWQEERDAGRRGARGGVQ
ncbi:hypothetical protein J4E93_001044 [Alternaria ventricosa]|uniref:uncharacterized protein n=1 Tax=Alternaria ventricosa TaxID=1187951 RepID=UPI0020C1D6A6|nr:uncharacterized protein J4E93_001044 [Alternaria ventricosa]KAI4653282.1 hypothetical protein J4E93_001044 [Alternaria ventricosa]